MSIRLPFVLLVAVLLAAPPALAQKFGTAGGTAAFTSRVPLHTFTGRSSGLTGEIDLGTNSVDFYVDLETIRTGIGRRDRDMRETLETDRFPFAEFEGSLLTSFNPNASGPQAARVRGTFTVHGVARTMTISGTLQQRSNGIRLVADFQVRLADHNIEPPRLLVVRVNQVQEVHIEALLTPR